MINVFRPTAITPCIPNLNEVSSGVFVEISLRWNHLQKKEIIESLELSMNRLWWSACAGVRACVHGWITPLINKALSPAEKSVKPCVLFGVCFDKECLYNTLHVVFVSTWRGSLWQYTQSEAVLQSREESRDEWAGEAWEEENEDVRVESSPCSLWQSEQEALFKKSRSIPRRQLLSSRPQQGWLNRRGLREQRSAEECWEM